MENWIENNDSFSTIWKYFYIVEYNDSLNLYNYL